ncbi:hypothetical protein Vadar_022091 [Vaccinium darrowii]|uniref:Uncharacterized protein n=1 Tax=Vaccinium darrowii TaxID=229202 RepID=A0ACB7YNW1_9ERIC|nr:hypothetical protein Vadar_022091 [Vaccinium darrowii]
MTPTARTSRRSLGKSRPRTASCQRPTRRCSLNKMKQRGQLVMLKNNYMKPDPNAAASQSRRVLFRSTPWRRSQGWPPKARDPSAPPSEAKPKASSSGREATWQAVEEGEGGGNWDGEGDE